MGYATKKFQKSLLLEKYDEVASEVDAIAEIVGESVKIDNIMNGPYAWRLEHARSRTEGMLNE